MAPSAHAEAPVVASPIAAIPIAMARRYRAGTRERGTKNNENMIPPLHSDEHDRERGVVDVAGDVRILQQAFDLEVVALRACGADREYAGRGETE